VDFEKRFWRSWGGVSREETGAFACLESHSSVPKLAVKPAFSKIIIFDGKMEVASL